MIHESMHAGNSDVKDKGYIGTQVFTQLAEDVKLTNAAHFEVIPRRILGAANGYAGVTFTPAGSAATPPLTALQTAVREASERLRIAWTMALNLHVQYTTLYKDQTLWNTPRGGGSFRLGLPYCLTGRATATEVTAGQATPEAHRDLRIKVALRAAGPVTGPEARDLRVVHELFALSTAFGTVLRHRDPNGFAD